VNKSSYQTYREWLKQREQGTVPPAEKQASRFERSADWTYKQQLGSDLRDGIA
jgi:hypothetical protein